MGSSHAHYPDKNAFGTLLRALLGPEVGYYRLILLYSLAISLLSLVLPVSVQLLIDTIANIGRVSAVVTIALLMLSLLLFSALLYAMRAWAMELFNRHLYSRVASEIAMTGLMAPAGYFEHGERSALFNRYFDIMILKKNVPYLLSYGFTLFFQTVIGFILVSLYHFYFFVFSLVFLLLVYLTWRALGWSAINSGFQVSETKHAAAAWLQGLGVNGGFFKARGRLDFALERTNALVHAHLDAQQRHFRYSFSQHIIYLLIYALSSAALLGLGGWLVIQGELTLGQLVAAELVLSSIFFGLPQLASYLDYYYDVCAAIEELSRFSAVSAETLPEAEPIVFPPAQPLQVRHVVCDSGARPLAFDFVLPPGALVRVIGYDGLAQDALNSLLKRALVPRSGTLSWGESDLLDCPLQDVRGLVTVLDRATLLPVSIHDYLRLAGPAVSGHRVQEVLSLLQLTEELAALPAGMQTELSYSSRPLVLEQALRLKLAFVLLSECRVLLMSEIFDCVDAGVLDDFLREFQRSRQGCALYYTRRPDLGRFTHTLQLGHELQHLQEVAG